MMMETPKRIWIVNYYTTPPEFVSNERHLKFAHYLIKEGYEVTIFSSSVIHGTGKNLVQGRAAYEERTYGEYRFVHIKTKNYSGNDLSRMRSIFLFAFRLFRLRNRFRRPDVILHNIHMPFDYPVLWCARKLKAKYIAEAWDLWPESFVRFGLIGKNNPLVKMAYLLEKRVYKKADRIIFSFEGGIDYLTDQGWDLANGGPVDTPKVHYINNGVDIEDFENNKRDHKLTDHDLEDDASFKVIYLGAIRHVNDLKQLIDAAILLKDHTDIKFLLYGDGPDRDVLESYCNEKSLQNIVFKQKWIELKYVPYVLSKSSLNILNYRKDFGIYGVSSGKLFQYLASGRPILSNIKMNYCLITKHHLGIAKNIETPQDYAEAILSIKNMDAGSYEAMCRRTKDAAREFDFINLSQRLIGVLNGLEIIQETNLSGQTPSG